MNTPYFLISEKILSQNIISFKEALGKYWPNSRLAYSVKTNSLPWVVGYMNEHQIMAEVVSDEEYQLAQLCGHSDGNIIFNGPIKGEGQFKKALDSGAIVNIDSRWEVEYIARYKPKHIENIGIRVNLEPDIFSPEDIGYAEDGFRFGFCEGNGEFSRIVELLRSLYGECRFGLHLHCNSITRSIGVYRSIAAYASYLIEKYRLSPAFIDIGGGFFGGVQGKPSPGEYLSIIRNELSKTVNLHLTRLILEPGSAVIGSAVELHTSVIDTKDTLRARIVTTDGSRIYIDPLWKKNAYLYSVQTDRTEKLLKEKQVICGYTCMDHDRIMVLKNAPELQVGDQIIYYRTGAYSVTFGGAFICSFPEVYVKKEHKIEKIRQRLTTQEYFKMQS